MGCGVCCLKCLLIFVNVIIIIIGAAILAAGVFVMVGMNGTLGTMLDSVINSLPALPGSFSLADAAAAPAELNFDIAAIIKPVAICLVVIGSVLVITAILGSAGACCNVKILLFLYAAIVLLMFLIQLILVILFFTGSLDPTIKKQMKKIVTDKYAGLDSFDAYSMSLNVMMTKLECCGIDDYQDFAGAKLWTSSRQFNYGIITVTQTMGFPLACCKFDGSFPSITPKNNLCAFSPATDAFRDQLTNWKSGCYAALQNIITPTERIVVGVIAGILVFQALCAVAAIVIGVKQAKDD